MADLDKLYQALDAADKAGAQDDIRDLTAMIKEAKVPATKPAEPKKPKTITDWTMGAGDVAASMLAGAVTTPLAGFAGALRTGGSLLAGDDLDTATDKGASVVNSIKGASYQPHSDTGKAIAGVASVPFSMASGVLGDAGEAVGGLVGPKAAIAGRVIGENAIDAAGAVYGAGALRTGLKAARAMKPELTQRQDAMLRAKESGYTPNPIDSAGGGVNVSLGTVANAPALDSLIANKNANVTTTLAKKAVGIPESSFLNEKTLAPLEAKAEQAYKAVSDAGDKLGVSFRPDNELAQALENADGTLHAQKATYPQYYKNNPLETIKAVILNPDESPTASVVMKLARDLRTDATRQLRNPSLNTSEIKGAVAMKKVATVLEDFVDRKLSTVIAEGGEAVAPAVPPRPALPAPQTPTLPSPTPVAPLGEAGPAVGSHAPQQVPPPPMKEGGMLSRSEGTSDLIAKYREARTQLAKIHNIRETTNLETGHLDPAKLKRLADNGTPLSGELADIVQAHKAMGHVVRGIEGGSANTGLRASDSTVGKAVGLAHAGAEYLGIPLAARKVMASDWYNKYMSNPTVSSLAQLKKLDPALAAKAVAAMNSARVQPNNDTLPPRMSQ